MPATDKKENVFMTVYRCPKCDTTFRHEEAKAVFCPRCQITLCETVEDIETPDISGGK